MQNIHYFTLPTGVSCGIVPLTGASQKIYSNQEYIKRGSMLGHLLKTIVASIGDCDSIVCNMSQAEREKKEGEAFDLYDLLEVDVNAILLEAHLLDVDFNPEFCFEKELQSWVWNKDKQDYTLQAKTIDFAINLEEVEKAPIKLPDGATSFKAAAFDSYADVMSKTRGVLVETSNGAYLFDFLNLRMMSRPTHNEKKKAVTYDILESLKARNLRDNTGKSLDLDSTPNKVLSAMQKAIKECEGKFDLSVKLENPLYNESLPMQDNNLPQIRTHLLALPMFIIKPFWFYKGNTR